MEKYNKIRSLNLGFVGVYRDLLGGSGLMGITEGIVWICRGCKYTYEVPLPLQVDPPTALHRAQLPTSRTYIDPFKSVWGVLMGFSF